MLRGRVASFAQGVCPLDSTPQTQGGLASGLEGLAGGAAPGAPCSSWYGVTKNPNPSLYYLSEGRRSLPSHETRANRRR